MIEYYHFGVLLNTDPPRLIHYGGEIYKDAIVEITTDIEPDYEPVATVELTALDKERLLNRAFKVVGSTRYSLLLRNCEHVANYIVKNHWFSEQISQNTRFKELYGMFIARIENITNVTPTDIDTKGDKLKLIDNPVVELNEHFEVILELSKDTNNILLLGPTGSGKSNLINFITGKRVQPTDLCPNSVTSHTSFIKCTRNAQTIYLIDTLGLTDSRWNPELIQKMIFSRLFSKNICIHQVWIVLRFDARLTTDEKMALKKAVKWIQKNKKMQNFRIILTHCPDDLIDGKKGIVINDFQHILLTEMQIPNQQFTVVNLKDPTMYTTTICDYNAQMELIASWLEHKPPHLDKSLSTFCNIL